MKVKIPRELIDQGYISVQKHTEADYYIYNHTLKTVAEKKWNEHTMRCAGLILNKKHVVMARPFDKFFSLNDYKADPDFNEYMTKPCEIYEKVNGTLGILYHLPSGEPRISTKDSFISEEAVKATEIFNKNYRAFNFDEDYTFLFEIIYPSTKNVSNYGNMEDLILLGAIHKETGEEAPFTMLQEYSILMSIPLVEVYNFIDLREAMQFIAETQNTQEFVIKFDSGLRIKVQNNDVK